MPEEEAEGSDGTAEADPANVNDILLESQNPAGEQGQQPEEITTDILNVEADGKLVQARHCILCLICK